MGRDAYVARVPILVVSLLLLAGCVSANVETVVTFSPPGGRFSVTVPGGTMDAGTLSTGGVFAAAPARTYATLGATGLRFAVVFADADPTYLAKTSLDTALAAAELANLETIGGTQQAERSLNIAGSSGLEQAHQRRLRCVCAEACLCWPSPVLDLSQRLGRPGR